MAEADVAYLNLVDTPCAFAERFSATRPSDVHTEEAVAYSWIICGDISRAMESLLRLEQVEANVPWIAALKVRGERIKYLLQSGELARAQDQLKVWQAESESNLKL